LLYGAGYVLMAYALAYLLQYFPGLALALAAACWMLGPFLAAGLYDIARQQQAFNGGRVMLLHSALAWRANPGALALYGCVMALLSCAWAGSSLLLFALFDQGRLPRLEALLPRLEALLPGLLHGDNLALLLSWAAVSLLFVLLLLALSICTCAMLLDKEIDAVTAMQASLQVVARNGVTMAVWAAMIVALVAIGLASQFVGLLLVAPLLGLSSWHAYRALISYEC
jgi:uncharacterized membrane protein